MFASRRGVSPLVATILLVAFSVGLGALVMSWGEDYIEQRAEFAQGVEEVKIGCDAVELSLINIGGTPQICRAGNTIEVWLDNGPNIDLYNIHARIAGTANVYVDEEMLDQPLPRENAVKASIQHAPVGNILQVKLTPKIYSGNEVITCTNKALLIEQLPTC